MSVKWSGYNNWQKLANAIPARAENVVSNAAQSVYQNANRIVPVDKGDLKASGHVEPGENRYTKFVVYGTDHCLYVEYGTRHMRAQPYLTPSMEKVAQHWERLFASIFDVKGL